MLEHHGEAMVLLSLRRVHIDSEAPAVHGLQLLGHEGSPGWVATYRPATEEEARPLREQQHEQREHRHARARHEVLAELTHHVAARGTHLDSGEPHRHSGQVIHSCLHLGCGEEVRVSDTDVVLIELHGLDGDSRAAHDAAGARVRVAPLSDPTARDLIRQGVPTLADKACTGTGADIRVPSAPAAGAGSSTPAPSRGLAGTSRPKGGGTLVNSPASGRCPHRDRGYGPRPERPGEPLLTQARCTGPPP
ncbi:hypothetical protein NUM3379_22970 [Kineococcus sp. NUM-3379]